MMTRLFILAFVIIQLCIPLHYYLLRKDENDERFAWRMFSPIHMRQCRTKLLLDDQLVVLPRKFHQAWIRIANRGRMHVINQMASKLCAENPGKSVRISVVCRAANGRQFHYPRPRNHCVTAPL